MSTTSLLAPAVSRPEREQAAATASRPSAGVFAAALLAVAGLFAIWSTCTVLWSMWNTDPLKSIGGLVPIVSVVLIARAWRALGWQLNGSWWGLAIVAATIALVHLRDQAVLELVLSPSWSIFLPPLSFVAVAYTAGVVLLFGGARLLRAAWFPVALVWLVNPVPHVFSRFIDLPLQHAAATLARSFAHALGQPLTPDQLRLMFTPEFGMFIAPGCNGIRGAITMGLIAVIAGYLYRFRLRTWIAATAAAVLLGYIFNFVRLCLLVLYYVAALHVAWLRDRAEMADYILGALLFFAATMLLFACIRRCSPARDLRIPALPVRVHEGSRHPVSILPYAIAFIVLICTGSVSYARAMLRASSPVRPANAARLPQQIGNYTLQREWNESLASGEVIFHWAEYTAHAGGPAITIGVSPVLGAHDTLLCHTARGEDWSWHGTLQFATAASATSFSGSLYNNGAAQYLEAATVCTGDSCGQVSTGARHFGLVYSRPDPGALLRERPSRPIPILLRAEIPDAAMLTDTARAELTASLRDFLRGANLAEFTQPYRVQ